MCKCEEFKAFGLKVDKKKCPFLRWCQEEEGLTRLSEVSNPSIIVADSQASDRFSIPNPRKPRKISP